MLKILQMYRVTQNKIKHFVGPGLTKHPVSITLALFPVRHKSITFKWSNEQVNDAELMPQARSSHTRQINRGWLKMTSKSYYLVLNLICLMWTHSFLGLLYYCLRLEIKWCEVGWKIKEAGADPAVSMFVSAQHWHPAAGLACIKTTSPTICSICSCVKASSDCWVTVADCSADHWNAVHITLKYLPSCAGMIKHKAIW